MKKALKIGAIVAVVHVVVLFLVLVFALDRIVKTGVEQALPKVIGAPVTLEDVDISLFSGKGTISGLEIGNPQGFETEHAFTLGTVTIDIDLPSLMSDTIVIEYLRIDAPEITYERALKGSNIGKIYQNIQDFAGPPRKRDEPEKEGEKKIRINHFVFKNATVGLLATLLRGEQVTLPLPAVELRDIGKEDDGASIGEAAVAIFKPLSTKISAVATEGIATMKKELAAAEETVKGGVDKVKDMGGTLKDEAKGIADDVKNIFK